MMKWIYLPLFFCVLAVQLKAQPYLHRRPVILKNKISCITRYEVYRKDGTLVKDTCYEYFDKAGRNVKTVFGGGRSQAIYQYDEHGNVTYVLFNYPGSKSEYKNAYEYDAEGRMTKNTDLMHPDYVTTYTYNETGKLVREELGGGAPKLYVYDKAGRLIEMYDEDRGKKFFREVFEFNANGDTLKQTKFEQGWSGSDTVITTWRYLPDGVIEKTESKESVLTVRTYNKNWDYISIVVTMRNGTVKKPVECKYDKNRFLLEYIMNEKYKSTFTYNSGGLVIKEVKENLKTGEKDHYIATYEYSFFD